MKIDPASFSQYEPVLDLEIISSNGKYGIMDGNGNVICPPVCEWIVPCMPLGIARMCYRNVEILLDRHSNLGTFMFFNGDWGVVYDISKRSILVLDDIEMCISNNKDNGCPLSEEEIKSKYIEFADIIKTHNTIITASEIKQKYPDEVKEFLDS